MRKSEPKTIVNQVLFDEKIPVYKKILDRLMADYSVVDGSIYEDLVNFKTNLKIPKHNWYDYKQGYSNLLVEHIIKETNPSKEYAILDPFCGVGTTNLTAQNLGYKTCGFDINPIAILASKAKTHCYTQDEKEAIAHMIDTFALPKEKVDISGGRVIDTSFTEEVLNEFLKIIFFIENIKDINIQNYFRLALISIIDKCSLKVKDGNGLKFKKNYKLVESVAFLFLQKSKEMLHDIEISNSKCESIFIHGSMFAEDNAKKIEDNSVGLCVFSPPYANCFDYCEVYKLEFWIGRFVHNYEDFEFYRSMALRSHVNSKFCHEFLYYNNEVDIIASLVSAFNIWNKNIPDMLRGYFDDMEKLIKKLSKVMISNSKCFIVVANSGYKGVLVPTDLLLADIARKYGFKVNNIYKARKIRSSSQQMQILNSDYDNLMRESVIELQISK